MEEDTAAEGMEAVVADMVERAAMVDMAAEAEEAAAAAVVVEDMEDEVVAEATVGEVRASLVC